MKYEYSHAKWRKKEQMKLINANVITRHNAIIISCDKQCFYNMFMKVAAIVFLFLIRLRYPHSKSLSEIIRRRYGDKIIKRLRKFEKIDYRLNFSFLNKENKKLLLELKESLLIMRDKPSLNRNIRSGPLYVFDKV